MLQLQGSGTDAAEAARRIAAGEVQVLDVRSHGEYEQLGHIPGAWLLPVDLIAAGPAIGGLAMAPDVSTEECFRLARAMTLKNAAASLPHGGGKSVLYGDPAMPPEEKEPLIRAMATALLGCGRGSSSRRM